MKKPAMSLKLVVLGMALAGLTSQASASGFQLFEGTAVNIGDFGAGSAALAEDASTAFYNPAGLVRIKNPQIVASAIGIHTKNDFTGQSAWSAFDGGIRANPLSGSANGGGWNLVPAFHYAIPLSDRVVFGFSATAPFGLSTDYAKDSVLRYEATHTSVKTLDLSPSLGIKINDQFSIGAGVDLEQMSATLDSSIPNPHYLPSPTPATDYQSHNTASDWAVGWHAGVLYQIIPTTRVGLNYASKINHSLKGASYFITDPATSFTSHDLNADVTLPATTTLSIAHDVNSCWTLLGSVVYTQWSEIKNLTLNNVAGFDSDGFPTTKATATLPMNFKDTWRFAVGTNYKLSEQWLVRAGLGYDQTPTNNTDRGARLPDGDRIAVSLGGHYQPIKALGLDAGYTHLFIKNGDINHTTPGIMNTTTVGSTKNSADLIGLQLTWNIV